MGRAAPARARGASAALLALLAAACAARPAAAARALPGTAAAQRAAGVNRRLMGSRHYSDDAFIQMVRGCAAPT